MKAWLLSVLVLVCCSATAVAQESKYPRAVLVQLRAERNRINAMTTRKMYKQADEVKEEATIIMKLMIADFTKNFRYCPVYYYMDTNLQKVLDRNFQGVLLNADLSAAPNVILNANDTDYMIVFYGKPVAQGARQKIVTQKERYEASGVEPSGTGLIINNYKMQQLHYFYKLGYQDMWMNKKKMQKKNFYESDKYDMEYFPFAASFNDLLKRHWQDKYRPSED